MKSNVIAEFMKLKGASKIGGYRYLYNSRWILPHNLDYDKNWNMLMPVIEKISSTVIKGNEPFNSDQFVRVEIVPNGYVKISNFRDTPVFRNVSIDKSLINACYNAVFDFITWYNKNHNNC